MERPVYRVAATATAGKWLLSVGGIPRLVAMASDWHEVEPVARDHIASWLQIDGDSFDIALARADGTADAEFVAMFIRHHDDLASHPWADDDPAWDRAVWLSAYFDDRVWDAPQWAFEKIGILVDALDADPDGPFGLLAAGRVEDFVREHGVEYLERLRTAAERSEKWRAAFRGAWGWSDPSKIDARVTAALVPYIGSDLR